MKREPHILPWTSRPLAGITEAVVRAPTFHVEGFITPFSRRPGEPPSLTVYHRLLPLSSGIEGFFGPWPTKAELDAAPAPGQAQPMRQRSPRSRRHPLRALGALLRVRPVRAFLWTCVLIVICLVGCVALRYEELRELALAQAERDREQARVEELEAANETLRQQREALETDLGAVELSARENLRMTRPGEQMIQVERSEPAEAGD